MYLKTLFFRKKNNLSESSCSLKYNILCRIEYLTLISVMYLKYIQHNAKLFFDNFIVSNRDSFNTEFKRYTNI